MKPAIAIAWVLGHGLIAAVLFGIARMFHAEAPTGVAFFALPFALGLFQTLMLRPYVRVWLWTPLSIVGFFAAFGFMWFFIPAIGFTMSLAQAFCFRTRPRFLSGVLWTVGGMSGWIIGLICGGKIMPNDGSEFAMPLYTTTALVYALFLSPALALIQRRHSACPAPASSPILPTT